MQITESIIERIARRVFNAMFPGALRQSNVGTGSGGGSVQYAAEAGHAETADSATSAGSANTVPWSGVSSKPAEATRWPTWSEVTSKPQFASVATSGNYNDLSNKPSIPSVSGSVSGSTLTITINGTSYSLTDTNTWRPIGTGATDAAAGNHLHDDRYLKLAGGTMTGNLEIRRTNSDDSHRSQIYVITPNDYPCDVVLGANNTQCWSWSARDSASAHSLLLWNFRTQESAMWVNGNTNNVGIGTQSPSYKLHVAGTIYATGGIGDLSDIRKKDVETYKWAPSLDMIADAPIIRYSMKDDKTHRMRVGSVAQYWEKVMPETVNQDDEGILSILTGDITLPSVIALAREVRKLKEEIAQLRQNGIQ